MSDATGTPDKLSASIGGDPIPLSDPAVPGQLVHINATPGNPDHNDLITGLLVTNRNASTVSLYLAVTGPGITPPASRDDMVRYDITSTEEGKGLTPLPTPLIILPGFSLQVSVTIPDLGVPLLLDGVVLSSDLPGTVADLPGYGGLNGENLVAPASIPVAPDWAVVPFSTSQTTVTKHVTLDIANDAISVDVEGVWQFSVYASLHVVDNANDRDYALQFYNLTDGVIVGRRLTFSIENQNDATFFSMTGLFEVDAGSVDKFLQARLQADSIAIGIDDWNATSLSMVLIDTAT